MKRTYSEMATALTILPQFEPGALKFSLAGSHKLLVTKVIDISKPANKPIEEIEEPEEEETNRTARLNKTNARMIQLDLIDSNNINIKAIELERIDMLKDIEPNSVISINGPVDVRCRNIMLEKKHVTNVEVGSVKRQEDEDKKAPPTPTTTLSQPTNDLRQVPIVNLVEEDWDDDDENDCILLD